MTGPQTLAAVVTMSDVEWLEFNEQGRRSPATEVPLQRIVPVGSLSKLVVSLAALSLAARAELDLDREAMSVRAAPNATAPSVRDLLCHTSGIPPWHWMRAERPQAWTAPGTVWSYGEVGHIVAAAELARAVQTPIRELIRERVADRCGLEILGHATRHDYEPGFERLGGLAVRMPPIGTDPASNGWLSHGMLARWSDLIALARSLLRGGELHTEARLLRTPYQSSAVRIPFQGIGARQVPHAGVTWTAHGGQWLGYGFFFAFGETVAVIVGSSGRRQNLPHVRLLARQLLSDLAHLETPRRRAETRGGSEPGRRTLSAAMHAAGPRCLNLTARQRYGDSIRFELTGDRVGTLRTSRRSYALVLVDGSEGLWSFRTRGEPCHVYLPEESDTPRYAVIERPCAIYRSR